MGWLNNKEDLIRWLPVVVPLLALVIALAVFIINVTVLVPGSS